MLIQALCRYDDALSAAGNVVPEGYSLVRVHNRVSLSPDGRVDGIEAWMVAKAVKDKKGKLKEVQEPHSVRMFRRTEKPGIEANCVEHRPVYLFGLMPDEDGAGGLTAVGKNAKAQKSHEAFVERSLSFIEGVDSPIVNAFRAFVRGWDPAGETENPYLKALGKGYAGAGYVFCLSGQPSVMLQDDPRLIARWDAMRREADERAGEHMGQCAVTGREADIAVLHDKITGVMGGLTTGTKLVCFNNTSEESYGAQQAVNSGVSVEAMRRYTRALNYLTGSRLHRSYLGELTVVRFAMSADERCDALIRTAIFDAPADADDGEDDALSAADTERLLADVYAEAREGKASVERLLMARDIDPGVEYCVAGFKPNASRLAVKFVYRRRFGDLILNAARHQADMALGADAKPVAAWQIAKQLVSPKVGKNSKETMHPALAAKLLESILYGYRYPPFLLATVVRRVRTDSDEEDNAFIKLNAIRAGVIKACLNRDARMKGQKEEIGMALDRTNPNPAYLCGRLFAVLEKIQTQANPGLNRTITDAYFSSASSRPSLIFPRLLKLAQNHLKKLEYAGYWNARVGEIIAMLGNEYPDALQLPDQGRFIIGYYQEKYAPSEKKQSEQAANKEG